jgi:hypothetical protein
VRQKLEGGPLHGVPVPALKHDLKVEQHQS